jgi:hypothetical protein
VAYIAVPAKLLGALERFRLGVATLAALPVWLSRLCTHPIRRLGTDTAGQKQYVGRASEAYAAIDSEPRGALRTRVRSSHIAQLQDYSAHLSYHGIAP